MKIRDYIGAVSRAAAEQGVARSFRSLLVGAAYLGRKDPAKLKEAINGIGELEEFASDAFEKWADPGEVLSSDGRKIFDVCDLRIWLEIAENAGVSAIPARSVASLTEREYEALLGSFQIPAHIRRNITNGLQAMGGDFEIPQKDAEQAMAGIDREVKARTQIARDTYQRIEGSLDDIPSSWMVRTQYSGSSNLKALVGTGLMLKADDTAMVAPGFEIGGGWVRKGNRRMIDFSDPRFLSTGVGGHKPGIEFLARPWIKARRFHEGEDIHRAGSPLAGPGKWPAEWRVFVRNSKVTGVGNYYAWTGEGATPENAWHAIAAAVQGQKMVDTALQHGLRGVFLDLEMLFNKHGEIWAEPLSGFDREEMHCTLDFLETDDGLTFVEAGPGSIPAVAGTLWLLPAKA